MTDQELDRDNAQFNQGVTHVVEMLARIIGAEGWVAGDGSEDYDEDLGQTLLNILAAKGLFDPDTATYAALASPPPAQISEEARNGVLEEAALLLEKTATKLRNEIDETYPEFGIDEAAKLAEERERAYRDAAGFIRAIKCDAPPATLNRERDGA